MIKLSDFLTILKNSNKIRKNIKFGLYLDFHMKNILTDQIDHLNFNDEKMIRSTQIICAMRGTIILRSLSLYIYILKNSK
jgi:hypothetical protein